MTVKSPSAVNLLVACDGCKRQYDAGALAPGSRFRCSCGQTVEVPRTRAHDAAVVRCSSCSAPRARGADACTHCGSDYTLHERDLHTICPSCMTRISDRARYCHHCATPIVPQGRAGEPSDDTCPVCGPGQKLNSRQLGKEGLAINECPSCAGLWIGHATFKMITERARSSKLEEGLGAGSTADKTVAAQSGPMYRKCPECDGVMHRRNFGRRSGVIIDTCKEHGIWFDADELNRILAWIRQGGEAESRRRNQFEKQQQQRTRNLPTKLDQLTQTYRSPSTSSFTSGSDNSLLGSLLGSLFDL